MAQVPSDLPAFRLANLFSTGAVLQRDRPVTVWGWAKAGTSVTVELAGGAVKLAARASANPDGRWQVTLPARPAGGPYMLKASSGEDTVQAGDILFGDVWICSGQSNMQWSTSLTKNAPAEVASANHPRIRLFNVPNVAVPTSLLDVNTKWQVCSPQTVGAFSAVGYFFGRELNRTQQVPIGLIANAWGGMPAESFADRDSLWADPASRPILERFDLAAKNDAEKIAAYQALSSHAATLPVDTGNEGEPKGWAKPTVDETGWTFANLPGAWDAPNAPDEGMDGVAWYRRTQTIPAEWVGKDLTLSLGPIDDNDWTYVNGTLVGSTGIDVVGAWAVPREYTIPGRLLASTSLTIAVRVFDSSGGGGFSGTPGAMSLRPKTSGDSISLAGPWRMKWERRVKSPTAVGGEQPWGPFNPSAPMQLYHGMVRPLAPFGVKGAIWYQGESNAGRAEQYRTLLPAMISSWRKTFGQGDFPFLVVSLANFMERNSDPVESDWAELRDAQWFTAKTVPNSALAMTIDIGEAGDIHPRNKQEVGRRLAVAARRIVYKDVTGGLSPAFLDAKVVGAKMLVRFAEGKGLKTSDGQAPVGFAIAGADRKFVWAQARIVGSTVEVWNSHVLKPVAVRYGWSANPAVNVVNGEDLPMIPFRSDAWPMVTAGRR